MDLLSIVEQNPDLNWQTLIGNIKIDDETAPSLVTLGEDEYDEEDKPSTVIKREDDAKENTASVADDDDDDLTSFTL